MYSEEFYPVFCNGGMYILSMRMISEIVCASKFTERGEFYLEDVYVTGLYYCLVPLFLFLLSC